MPASSPTVRWSWYLAAISAVGLGVALMVRSRLGVSPNDVTNTGIARVSGLSVGAASWATSVTAMGLAWLMGRRPRPATVLGGFVVGVTIALGMRWIPEPDAWAWRAVLLTAGLVVVWAGITGVVAADVGAGPIELIMLAMLDRRVDIRVARWSIEIALFAIGVALGGAIGLGTVLFAVLTGPVLARTLPAASGALGTQLRKAEVEAPHR